MCLHEVCIKCWAFPCAEIFPHDPQVHSKALLV